MKPSKFTQVATMLAVTLQDFGGTDNFRIELVPLPEVTKDNILVQIKAVSFNPIDYQMRLGLGEKKLLRSSILGREFAGKIVGGDLSDTPFQSGEAVYGYVGSLGSNGTYAEYICVPSGLLARIPKKLSYEQAAAIPMVGLTALQSVDRLQIPSSTSVFVAGGAGGVGTWLLKLLLAAGVQRLVTTAGNQASREALLQLGLSDTCILDYREPRLVERALALNEGAPYNYCLDTVGGALSEVCAELLTIHGSYADFTALITAVSRDMLFDKGATLYLISNYAVSLSQDPSVLSYYGEKLSQLSRWLEAGKISAPEVTIVGPFGEDTVRKAHAMLERNETKGRKLVMTIGANPFLKQLL